MSNKALIQEKIDRVMEFAVSEFGIPRDRVVGYLIQVFKLETRKRDFQTANLERKRVLAGFPKVGKAADALGVNSFRLRRGGVRKVGGSGSGGAGGSVVFASLRGDNMRLRISRDLAGKAMTCCEAVGMTLEAWIGKSVRRYPDCFERVPGGTRSGSVVVVCPDSMDTDDPEIIRGRMSRAVEEDYESARLAGLEGAITVLAGFSGRPTSEVRAEIMQRIELGRSLTV